MELQKSQNDIVKVCVWFNLLVLIVGIFYQRLWLFYTGLVLNILLLSTYMIFTKYFMLFAGITMANKLVRTVSNKLEGLNGQISREI